MTTPSKNDILEIVLSIAKTIQYNGKMLNERYLHHYFSHCLQEKRPILNIADTKNNIILHPEWPTYKKETGLLYGKYRKENKIFIIDQVNGTAGFIDFAIGDYDRPNIGIEFTLKYGWGNEEIVYDFMKLMDKYNPFNLGISYNVIFREKRLVKGGYYKRLFNRMNYAYEEAKIRLNENLCNPSREIYFIISEIDSLQNRKHWHFDKTRNQFIEGLPLI